MCRFFTLTILLLPAAGSYLSGLVAVLYAVGVRPSKDRTSRVWSRHEKNKKALEMLQHLI